MSRRCSSSHLIGGWRTSTSLKAGSNLATLGSLPTECALQGMVFDRPRDRSPIPPDHDTPVSDPDVIHAPADVGAERVAQAGTDVVAHVARVEPAMALLFSARRASHLESGQTPASCRRPTAGARPQRPLRRPPNAPPTIRPTAANRSPFAIASPRQARAGAPIPARRPPAPRAAAARPAGAGSRPPRRALPGVARPAGARCSSRLRRRIATHGRSPRTARRSLM